MGRANIKESKAEIRKIAKSVVLDEMKAIEGLLERIDQDFETTVELILNSTGRIVISGIGKSALIANKIVATLNSTGSPSLFMHAADAIHGDLGMVQKDDVVICISKSGESPEIKVLAPLIKDRGNKLIAMVGNRESYLALQADLILDTYVEKEACPNNLTPTSSTTAQLVMGDALAIALLESKGFSSHDFAKFHPGGALGKRMFLRVHDLMIKNECPRVEKKASLHNIILEISAKRMGATAVMDESRLIGIITDGDLRRLLQKEIDLKMVTADEIMSHNPKSIEAEALVVDALSIMRNNNITQLTVLNNGSYAGMIHLHDILKEGIF